MHVLVSDTSVLVDLERGSLLEASFRLPFRFVVPDLLYERELKNYSGEELIRLGLVIEELDGDGVSLALAYRQQAPALLYVDSGGGGGQGGGRRWESPLALRLSEAVGESWASQRNQRRARTVEWAQRARMKCKVGRLRREPCKQRSMLGLI